jgi:hypothetical protein
MPKWLNPIDRPRLQEIRPMPTESQFDQTHQYTPSVIRVSAAAPESSPNQLPSEWGDYQHLTAMGQGAMGLVYRGWHQGLQRWEAIKVMNNGATATDTDFQRFHFEAEAAAGLDHPNIVPVYRVGNVEGTPYFAMKWIDGSTLSDKMHTFKDKPLEIAGLLAKLARAIHHAHQHGILHRDLKPKNVMLDQNGEPHILDFGLARRADAIDNGLTQSGSVIGTPSYMSPEQAKSVKHLTTAVDIYALGAILYEFLTGRVPFQASNLFELLNMIGHDQPAMPSAVNPKVHADLQAICMKCLEKEPGNRYPSAMELAEDLERVTRGEGILIRPPGLKDWIIRELTKVPAPFAGYVIEVKYWFAALMLMGQLAIYLLCQQGGPVWGVWLVYILAWGGCALSLWWYMAARFTRLPLTEQHSVMVAVGHLVTHIVYNFFCLPVSGPATIVLTLYPAYTMISGLALFVIGTTHWGRFYWYGLLVMGLLPFVMWFENFSPLIYGIPVACSMLSWALMLRKLIRQAP